MRSRTGPNRAEDENDGDVPQTGGPEDLFDKANLLVLDTGFFMCIF